MLREECGISPLSLLVCDFLGHASCLDRTRTRRRLLFPRNGGSSEVSEKGKRK